MPLNENDLKNKSDVELVEQAKIDPESFALLISRYKDQLFRYIRRIGYFSKEDVEDILQEVFIKAYRNLNEYNPELKFSSWIYRITHNQVVDEIRKASKRSQILSIDDNEIINFLRSSINIEKEIGSRECLEQVKAIINRMSLKYKEVLILRFLEEKEYEEIVDILKKPKGTVATLINRGRQMLIKELKKQGIKCL